MKNKIRQSDMGGLMVLLLLCIFAVCILSVLFAGIRNYRTIMERDKDSYNCRTSLQYIAEKVREADAKDCIYAGSFDDTKEELTRDSLTGDTLFILEEYDGEIYITRIYEYKGYIRELFTQESFMLDRQAGEKILPAEEICFEMDGRRLHTKIVDENRKEYSLTLSIRSALTGKEEAQNEK